MGKNAAQTIYELDPINRVDRDLTPGIQASWHEIVPRWRPGLTSSFGVDHPLWDALAVKVRHLVGEHDILYQQGPPGASRLLVQLVPYRNPCSSRQSVRFLT